MRFPATREMNAGDGGPARIHRELAPTAAPSDAGGASVAVARPTPAIAHQAISPAMLSSGGAPLAPPVRDFFEARFGRDLQSVRVHTGPESARYNAALHARAFAFGNHVWLGRGQSAATTQLLAHELVHTIQQSAEPAPYVARSAEDWLVSSPAVGTMSYTELHDEIDDLTEWLDRQIESSEESSRIEQALAALRAEVARRNALARRDRRRTRRQRGQAATQAESEAAARRPRVLVENTSVAYEDPQEMRFEYDLIMEWLARDDLTAAQRELLRIERDNLAPQFQQDRQRVVAERRALRLQAALTPADDAPGRELEIAARAIQRIEPDPQNPDVLYLHHGNERIPIAPHQAELLRREVPRHLQRALDSIKNRLRTAWDRYEYQVQLNEDTFLIDDIASWLGGVSDPGEELVRRRIQAWRRVRHLQSEIIGGRLVEAAALLPSVERDGQVVHDIAMAFIEGQIEGAGRAIGALEFTRDAAFAVAATIAAVVAAPVVAGCVGVGGITGGVLTTAGTGVVVRTGTATVRGGSAALGEAAAGGSGARISAAFWGEARRGFREGFLAGAGGGAARALGVAISAGGTFSVQVAQRVAAGALVDGTTAMVEVLWNGGSIADAVAAGGRAALASVPGSLIGSAGNQLVREIGGPLTAGATSFLSAIGSGASREDAMRAAGLAVASNLAMGRATGGSDAALVARGQALRADTDAALATAGRRIRQSTAAIMIGAAEPIPALRSGYGGALVADVAPAFALSRPAAQAAPTSAAARADAPAPRPAEQARVASTNDATTAPRPDAEGMRTPYEGDEVFARLGQELQTDPVQNRTYSSREQEIRAAVRDGRHDRPGAAGGGPVGAGSSKRASVWITSAKGRSGTTGNSRWIGKPANGICDAEY